MGADMTPSTKMKEIRDSRIRNLEEILTDLGTQIESVERRMSTSADDSEYGQWYARRRELLSEWLQTRNQLQYLGA